MPTEISIVVELLIFAKWLPMQPSDWINPATQPCPPKNVKWSPALCFD
jgi:hypothetical protein